MAPPGRPTWRGSVSTGGGAIPPLRDPGRLRRVCRGHGRPRPQWVRSWRCTVHDGTMSKVPKIFSRLTPKNGEVSDLCPPLRGVKWAHCGTASRATYLSRRPPCLIALGKETRAHRRPIVSTTVSVGTPHGVNGNPQGVVACRSRSTPVGATAVRHMRADKYARHHLGGAALHPGTGRPPLKHPPRTRAQPNLHFRLPCMRPPASLSYNRPHLSAAARCVEIPLGIPFTVAPWRCATARSRDVQDGGSR